MSYGLNFSEANTVREITMYQKSENLNLLKKIENE